MVKKFGLWFICFGLSFLVESFGWTEQGKAFLYIEIVANVLILVSLFGRSDALLEKLRNPFLMVIGCAILIGIELFVTWGATKLFDVDFYVAYQIMSLGQCLCTSDKENDD